LRDWPIRQIEINIPLSDSQRAALYDLTASIYRAVGTLIASCPTEASLTPLGEIEVKRKRANALRQAAGIIRPVLGRFEGTLDDGQKMRLGQVIGGFNDENWSSAPVGWITAASALGIEIASASPSAMAKFDNVAGQRTNKEKAPAARPGRGWDLCVTGLTRDD